MFRTRYSIPGSPPATLRPHVVEGKTRRPTITLIEYDESHLDERKIEDVTELTSNLESKKVTWINIDGLGDVEPLRKLGERFALHPLTLEDVLNTGQRPKTEAHDQYIFVVAQMLYRDHQEKLCGEQVSLFFGDNFVITVQEEAKFDVFNPVRDRIRSSNGKIRRAKSDYLAYALLDSIIDHYYPALDSIGMAIEKLEEELIGTPSEKMVRSLHQYKRALTQLRRFVWPARDVVNALLHDGSGHVRDETKIYLRDCYDHTVQLMDLVESYRDVTSGLMDLYLSTVSQRTNEIMRVLTVITSIFIPLTFVVGVYGMNFSPAPPPERPFWLNMPELYHPYGYVVVLGFMLLVACIQIYLFKRKKWL